MEAINQGLSILSWYENYVEKDIPEENLWDDAEYVEKHWKAVRERRDGGVDPAEELDAGSSDGQRMLGNDLADAFRG